MVGVEWAFGVKELGRYVAWAVRVGYESGIFARDIAWDVENPLIGGA